MKRRGQPTPRKGTSADMTKPEDAAFDETMLEFSMDELREFLEADHLEVHADPEFKETLRQKLWNLVRSRRRRA